MSAGTSSSADWIRTDTYALANDSVTNAKLNNMATATIKGRTTAGTGDPEDLSVTQATALLNTVVGDSGSGGVKGLAPATGAGDAAAGKFLRADATWAVPSDAATLVSAATLSINTQTDDYTLVLGDGNGRTVVAMNKGSAVALTVPLNASVAFVVGKPITILALGAGAVSIVPTGGVTLNGAGDTLVISDQWKAATLLKLATDDWWVTGALD